MGRNVDISNDDLPGRLKILREQRHLTQADLADLAGLSYRTVLDLERGRRERVQVKTLMLLSEALGVSYEELLGNAVESSDRGPTFEQAPAPGVSESKFRGLPKRPWFLAVLAASALIILAGFLILGNVSAARYELDRDGMMFVARDDWLGVRCWAREFNARISVHRIAPWSDDIVLVGLYGDTVSGGGLIALDRITGETIWELMPDIDAVARAFGEEVAYSGNYSCTGFATPDLDGDGEAELVARFCHGLWYPNTLCFIDPAGRITSQYSHKGHIYALHCADLDLDGKDELIAAGTNNTLAYQGATVFVLDETHRSGASVDREAAPGSTEPDSALVRVVIPRFPEPYMQIIGVKRLEANQVKTYANADGKVHVSLVVGGSGAGMMLVDLDSELRPLSCGVSDGFLGKIAREHWPDSLVVDTGPGDEAWRMAWLDGHLRFEAGHWPPSLPIEP